MVLFVLILSFVFAVVGCSRNSDDDDKDNDVPTYYVTFQVNGGQEIEQMSIIDGEAIVLPTPIREGFIFQGWFRNSTLTQPFTEGTVISSNLTLYARWQRVSVNQFTVTFEVNGGEPIQPIIVEANVVFSPPTPVREGYTFDGWFTNSTLTTRYRENSTVTQNITLYAKWIQNV
jgi:uncharacterized repeat protein (TIGR02543 family)